MLEIQIAKTEPYPVISKYVPLNQDETKLMKRFTGSVDAKLFKISYKLHFTVKHDF